MKVLLLHALPFDGRMWDETSRSLSLETASPDMFALGQSIEHWADALLDQLEGEDLIVVGCSVGGSCALEIARTAPEQVKGLVLVGAKAEVSPDQALRDEAIKLLETDGIRAAWERYWSPLFAIDCPTSVKDAAKDLALAQDVVEVINGVRAFHDRRDLSGFAASWARPLIGISGDRDTAPAPWKLQQLATGKNRAFHRVKASGHYVNLEQPKAFAAILNDAIGAIIDPSAGSSARIPTVRPSVNRWPSSTDG